MLFFVEDVLVDPSCLVCLILGVYGSIGCQTDKVSETISECLVVHREIERGKAHLQPLSKVTIRCIMKIKLASTILLINVLFLSIHMT